MSKSSNTEIAGRGDLSSSAHPIGKPAPKDPRKGDRHRPGYYKEYMRKYRRGEVGNKFKGKG